MKCGTVCIFIYYVGVPRASESKGFWFSSSVSMNIKLEGMWVKAVMVSWCTFQALA